VDEKTFLIFHGCLSLDGLEFPVKVGDVVEAGLVYNHTPDPCGWIHPGPDGGMISYSGWKWNEKSL
jgi:hypothetical protein